ncbi:cell division protein FtsQ/DivIB [Lactobacillus gigeriorum]|nr:FtsQ-type POTRA domain-containing protein [Lactobacillus gigeriorum]KRN14734.1 cell division protein [Lactobacillus gigeriorum DSM 23908 = CRBIP 24.85]
MAKEKKTVTKIDPRKELSPYLNHISDRQKKKSKKPKLSTSLSKLRYERRKSLSINLGIILGVSFIAILCLGYYVSPLANISVVQVLGAEDLPSKQLVQNSGINASDKVVTYTSHKQKLTKRLSGKYPEIKQISVSVKNLNQLVLNVKEYEAIGFIKDGDRYRKILSNGKIGSQSLAWSEINQDKPIFIGYSHKVSLKDDLKLFNSFPDEFRNQVKLLSASTKRRTQIILVMKDGNVIIGNIDTLGNKIQYYDIIKKKAGKNSLIDFEIGAFSRPLNSHEKKAFGIS